MGDRSLWLENLAFLLVAFTFTTSGPMRLRNERSRGGWLPRTARRSPPKPNSRSRLSAADHRRGADFIVDAPPDGCCGSMSNARAGSGCNRCAYQSCRKDLVVRTFRSANVQVRHGGHLSPKSGGKRWRTFTTPPMRRLPASDCRLSARRQPAIPIYAGRSNRFSRKTTSPMSSTRRSR